MRRGPSESRPAERAKGAAELEKSTVYLRHSKDGSGVLWPPRAVVKITLETICVVRYSLRRSVSIKIILFKEF